MLDLSHIPNSQQDIKIFYANQDAFAYQTWQKPRKCSFIYILCIGAGSAGIPGISSNLNTIAQSGYAGSSGAVNRCLINSNLVPDVLYVKVGKGGKGASNPNIGGGVLLGAQSGESSGIFISTARSSQESTNQANSFIGGNDASTFLAGGTVSIQSNNYLIGLTNFISLAGITSTGGTLTTQPPNISPLASQIVMAGGTGAPYNGTATAFNGASISATSISPLIAGGIGGSTLGGNGADGYTSWNPLFSTGGAGGGNSYTAGGVAGNGGNGGIGSGGGAGGSANFGTAGKGGDGGDGLVVIITF